MKIFGLFAVAALAQDVAYTCKNNKKQRNILADVNRDDISNAQYTCDTMEEAQALYDAMELVSYISL